MFPREIYPRNLENSDYHPISFPKEFSIFKNSEILANPIFVYYGYLNLKISQVLYKLEI